MIVLRRTSFRLAALAAACLVAGACAEGGAFGPLPDDRVYVMSASTPLLIHSWNDGKYYGEFVLTADTVILRADGTGEARTYSERRRAEGITPSVSRSLFSYTRGADQLVLRYRTHCSGICTLPLGPPGTEYISLTDGVLHRDAGAGLIPYRRIE